MHRVAGGDVAERVGSEGLDLKIPAPLGAVRDRTARDSESKNQYGQR